MGAAITHVLSRLPLCVIISDVTARPNYASSRSTITKLRLVTLHYHRYSGLLYGSTVYINLHCVLGPPLASW